MAKVIVFHRYYGCDTGCCGHAVEVYADDVVAKKGFEPGWDDDLGPSRFDFAHPYDDYDDAAKLKWAQEFVRDELGEDHVKDLDWEHCIISTD